MTLTLFDQKIGMMGIQNSFRPTEKLTERYSGINLCQTSLSSSLIRPGLVLLAIDQKQNECMTFNFEVDQAYLSLVFCIKGQGTTTYHGNQRSRIISMSPSTSVLSFMPHTSGTTRTLQGNAIQFLRLFIEPQLFFRYLGDDIDKVPRSLSAINDNPERAGFIRHFQTGYQEQTLLHQIIHCSLRGSARQLAIEGALLTLLGINSAKLTEDTVKAGKRQISLSKQDIEALHYVRDLLISDLAHPRTIVELARMSRLNEFKLKTGFRQVFSSSIYQYYQKNRMEKAKLMLLERKLNVSEIAWEVGYTNVSHFCTAYRKLFGVKPGSFLKEIRRH